MLFFFVISGGTDPFFWKRSLKSKVLNGVSENALDSAIPVGFVNMSILVVLGLLCAFGRF